MVFSILQNDGGTQARPVCGICNKLSRAAWVLVWSFLSAGYIQGATTLDSYYAHPRHEDEFGVIAPWYEGLNGQIDARLRIAAEVMKRYPWVGTDKAVMAAPDFVYNSHWSIKDDGTILIPPTNDWMCGDLSQRAWSIIRGLTGYYGYSGDPMAFLYIPLTADYILDYGQTPADHPWPNFPISTPTRGKAYGQCDPETRNQLDLCAMVGTEMVRAYRLTGTKRYLEAAKHWGDLFAEKAQLNDPTNPPWNRYVDPSVVDWSDELTGSVALILEFLDSLIELGYTGENDKIVTARDAGVAFLRDQMLPRWLENDTWGRQYWDWDNPVQCGITSMIADYIIINRDKFSHWHTDMRNIMSLVMHRNGADPYSHGNMYSGAWAFPESCTCCGTSLSYNQYTAAPTFLRLAAAGDDDEWAREIGRRMLMMATYDSDTNGVVKDGLFGKSVATGEWSNLAHPWPLCQLVEAIGLAPELFAPNRENHIVRSSEVVTHVVYDKGRIAYQTFAHGGQSIDILRLAFIPERITADGKPLQRRQELKENGFTVQSLGNGDILLRIRHDGATNIVIEGDDPQNIINDEMLAYDGSWNTEKDSSCKDGAMRATHEAEAAASYTFTGNQVRIIGSVGPDGGLADVFIDGEKQLTLVDFWNPAPRHQQVVYSRSGLTNSNHEIKLIARGRGNPISGGTLVNIDGLQVSQATGDAGYGVGGGPAGPQRMIFGYPERSDYIDSAGNAWRPGTEFVIRSGYGHDTVKQSWWTDRRSMYIGNTGDEMLYRYGVHGEEFWVNLTVAPGRYYVILKFADTPLHPFLEKDAYGRRITHTVTAAINGREVMKNVNIAEAAGGLFKAVDFTFEHIAARHGAIDIHFKGEDGEAIINAIEIGPGPGPKRRGYEYIQGKQNLLKNGGFLADYVKVPQGDRWTTDEPAEWTIAPVNDDSNGIQNVTWWGGDAAAWISPGQTLTQVMKDTPIEPSQTYRLGVRLLGKGVHGKDNTTAAGNRGGMTVYWVSNPEKPFDGEEGRSWGHIAELGVIFERDQQWRDLEQSFTATDEHAGKYFAVRGWYEHQNGSPKSYCYFDEMFVGFPLRTEIK